jgi:hypothetical protein
MLNWVYANSNFNFDEKKEILKKYSQVCKIWETAGPQKISFI